MAEKREDFEELKRVVSSFLNSEQPENIYLGFRFAYIWAMIADSSEITLSDEFISFVKEKANMNKKKLEECKIYINKEYPEGLWGDMKLMDEKLIKSKGKSLLLYS